MICPKCGIQMDNNNKFCINCGAVNPIQEQPAQPIQAPKSRKALIFNLISLVSSMLGAVLLIIGSKRLNDLENTLWIFNGFVDYFKKYPGMLKMAFAMIVFGGICGIISVYICFHLRKNHINGIGIAGAILGCVVIFSSVYQLYHYYEITDSYNITKLRYLFK